MHNCIYVYLYHIGDAEVEINPPDAARAMAPVLGKSVQGLNDRYHELSCPEQNLHRTQIFALLVEGLLAIFEPSHRRRDRRHADIL